MKNTESKFKMRRGKGTGKTSGQKGIFYKLNFNLVYNHQIFNHLLFYIFFYVS